MTATRMAQGLERAVELLARHEGHFLRPVPDVRELVKRVAEVAMLADLIAQAEPGRLPAAVCQAAGDLLERGWAAIGRGELLADLVDRDPAWVGVVPVYVPFHRRGLRNPRFDAQLQRHADAVGPIWFVQLAAAMAFRALGVASSLDADALLARSWIASATGFAPIPVERAYETTHVAMWLAALGPLPEPIRARVEAWAPKWMDAALAQRDADVAAELAIAVHHAGACVGAPRWQRLLALQARDGSFLPLRQPAGQLFHRFHATAVGAMALAQCLGPCGHRI
jgi:hypothetical protein